MSNELETRTALPDWLTAPALQPGRPGIEAFADARILVVDDQPANITLLEQILTQVGLRNLCTTTDSTAAADLFSQFQPDLVVLDLHMPVMDGFAVMAEIQRRLAPGTYLPILVITSDSRAATSRQALALGATDFVTRPLRVAEVLLRIRNLLETRSLHERLRERNAGLEAEVRRRTKRLAEAQTEALELLALAAEYRDDQTGRHTRRVGALAALIAREMGLSEQEAEQIRDAALLHDVGKVGVPDRILLKEGSISDAEREIMQRHTLIGMRILSRSAFPVMRLAAEIAASHHEWWDGSGYPRGLRGEEIPLAGRIVALADVYDSLTHARPYKRAWTQEEALAEIASGRGTHFDPRAVEAIFALHARGALPPAEPFEESGDPPYAGTPPLGWRRRAARLAARLFGRRA
ncbi:MAG: response regulator [Gemmatimonadetes bacterium]|nr:response regulator [Gemmatimonadota bacterium]